MSHNMSEAEKKEVEEVAGHYKRLGGEHAKMVNIGYVYFLRAENGLFKIGRTNNVDKRLRSIQNMSPEKLELFHYFPTWNCVGAEKFLHDAWAEYRVHGEWFDLPNDEIHNIKKARVNSL